MADEQAPTPTPLESALQRHADRLVPGGAAQLAKIWGEELQNTPPSAISEVVDARLASPAYAHFRRPAEAPTPTPAAPAEPAVPAYLRQMAAGAANGELVGKQVATNVQAARGAGACGLAGTYGK